MSCCKHTTMLFTDPRDRSPSALGRYGLLFSCNNLDAAMTNLSALLDQATAAGLLTTHLFSADEGDPVAVSAQAVYSGIKNNNLVVMSQTACDANTTEANAAVASLQNLLQTNGQAPVTLRPDYVPQPTSPLNDGLPVWAYAIIGVVGLGAVAYIFGQAGTIAKVIGISRKHTAGYRRRRSKR